MATPVIAMHFERGARKQMTIAIAFAIAIPGTRTRDPQKIASNSMAIKEAGKAGRILATCVDDQEQHLRLCKEGVLTCLVGQKRELFTYLGVRALFEINHSPLKFTSNDRAAGIWPIPVVYNTGAYTVTRENVDLFLKPA